MNIQFLKDTKNAILPDKKLLIVYRQGYELPDIDVEKMEFEKFRLVYGTLDYDLLCIFGLNRIIKPHNRCDLVFEYLQTLSCGTKKIVVDTEPFLGEPWRFWFHYSVALGSFLDMNYSYVVETDWKKWFYREQNECILSPDNIQKKIHSTYSDLPEVCFNVTFFQPDNFILNHYNAIKEDSFIRHNTFKAIMLDITRGLKSVGVHLDFDAYKSKIKHLWPDLPICRFYAEENNRRASIYNKIIKSGRYND